MGSAELAELRDMAQNFGLWGLLGKTLAIVPGVTEFRVAPLPLSPVQLLPLI